MQPCPNVGALSTGAIPASQNEPTGRAVGRLGLGEFVLGGRITRAPLGRLVVCGDGGAPGVHHPQTNLEG